MKRSGIVLLSMLGALLVFTRSAYAYLDPGSGSMLLQLLLGGTAGIAVIVKLYYRRFLAFLGLKADQGTEERQSNAGPDTDAAQR